MKTRNNNIPQVFVRIVYYDPSFIDQAFAKFFGLLKQNCSLNCDSKRYNLQYHVKSNNLSSDKLERWKASINF